MKITKEVLKQAAKEAIKELIEEKSATLGRWSLGFITTAALAALVYFILWANGWKLTN